MPDRQAFIEGMWPYAFKWSQLTGIPPQVFIAIGASESNWGATGTLFGIKGQGTAGSQDYKTWEMVNGVATPTTAGFAKYNSPDEAFQSFLSLVTQGRYAPAWQNYQRSGDWRQFLGDLNQAGYATDPKWADKIGNLANSLQTPEGEIRPPAPTAQPTNASGVGDGGQGNTVIIDLGGGFRAIREQNEFGDWKTIHVIDDRGKPFDPLELASAWRQQYIDKINAGQMTKKNALDEYDARLKQLGFEFQVAEAQQTRASAIMAEKTRRAQVLARDILPNFLPGQSSINVPYLGNVGLNPINLNTIFGPPPEESMPAFPNFQAPPAPQVAGAVPPPGPNPFLAQLFGGM